LIQLLLLLGFALFAMLAVRQYLNAAPTGIARKFRRALVWGGVVFVLLLAATGRLGVLIPLIGALIATVLRLLPVLVPMLLQYLPLWKRWQQQQRARRPHPAGGADASTVESKFLRMHLDHTTGEIAGEVLAGRHAGRQLGELDREQLADLYAECVQGDRESATLLRAYLERVYGETWEARQDGGRESAPSDGRMTADEAYEVLGLKRGASRDDIVGAHRRLMQRLHPDRGGSDYLAAKINQAKDILLGH
jgi:hypothetical protein